MLNILSLRAIRSLTLVALFATLTACGGGGSGNSNTPTTPVTPPAPTAASINLSVSPPSVKTDNSDTTTITATVLNSSNAAVAGVTVTFATDTGILSTSSAVSDATGKAIATFSSGGGNGINRTATVTVASGSITSQIPITITGTTIDLTTNTTSLTIGGATATLTATVKNAGGVALANIPVTLTSTGTAGVTINPVAATTNASGQITAQVAGLTAGAGTVTVTAAGATRTVNFSIVGAAAFAISSTVPTASNRIVALSLNPIPPSTTPVATLVVNVTAPVGATVVFVSTSGTWANNAAQHSVVASNGTATDTLTVTAAGVASIQVFNAANPATTDSLTASITASVANAARITLQAVPNVVAPASGGTAGVSSLLATVTNAANQPVGGATVAFEIVNPTGGGETVGPVVAQTLTVATSGQALGQALATFTAGSLPSGAGGVQIRATVVENPSVRTGNGNSGNDASIVIGGTAGSVAIGRASVIQDTANSTAYTLPMSVLVADANGNPVTNTTVSLSSWPIAWAPGGGCSPGPYYYNEDTNENLNLDLATEDGVRRLYPNGSTTIGTRDQQATPPNSASGTLPATVVTNASGLATFNLTYTKSNALFIVARIRASTRVQGTETVGETRFPLPALISDIGPPCLLPPSPYTF